jgi:hypothetical protein
MKKSIFTVSAMIGLLTVATSFSAREITQPYESCSGIAGETPKNETYKIRYGLLSKNGTKILSGNYDVGSFLAENISTGEVHIMVVDFNQFRNIMMVFLQEPIIFLQHRVREAG